MVKRKRWLNSQARDLVAAIVVVAAIAGAWIGHSAWVANVKP